MEQKILDDTIKFSKAIVVNPPFDDNANAKAIPVAPHLHLLSVREVCRRLCIGRSMVYQLIAENKLRSIPIGTRRLISIQALEDFINQFDKDF